jgi:hypothetical protein
LRIIALEQSSQNTKTEPRRNKKMLHLAFTEADYEMRRSSEEYASIREAEELVL